MLVGWRVIGLVENVAPGAIKREKDKKVASEVKGENEGRRLARFRKRG